MEYWSPNIASAISESKTRVSAKWTGGKEVHGLNALSYSWYYTSSVEILSLPDTFILISIKLGKHFYLAGL